ncbi:PAS domain-containing protein [Fodinicurvata sediminis]|uniref:PAS domain-containing protein n=1 Tax=Fodinicurvata sediminis TaxID=1121832 RepID=UPI0003B76FF7|nr:PAS domain-containing protein [Fodinicurvata sediminis]
MLQALEEEYRHLIGLWKEARRGQGVPTREHFDPMTLRGLVSRVHLLEFEGQDKLIFRLSGTNEQARLGEDPKGEDYLAIVDAPARAYLLQNMHTTLFHPAGLVVTTEEIHADGSRIPTRFIALPLRDARRGRDQVIALVSEKGPKQYLQVTFPVPRDREWHDEVIAVETVDLGNGIPDIPIYKREALSS